MDTYTVEAENARYRWTIYRDGKKLCTGTRKRENEAKSEAEGSIRHFEKVRRQDRRA